MIALDTNVLVYAHRAEMPLHDRARRVLTELAEGAQDWSIPWHCLHEFFAVVTSPRLFVPPSTPAQAIRQVDAWIGSPTFVALREGAGYWAVLKGVLEESRVTGGRVHDARIAAVCMSEGIDELWSADRDFSRFPRLRVRNPLIG